MPDTDSGFIFDEYEDVPEFKPKHRKERKVEKYFIKACEKRGVKQRKAAWIGRRGAPDRMVGKPGYLPGFIELKDERGKLSPNQIGEIADLRAMGFRVEVAYSEADVDIILDRWFPR